MTAWRVQQQQQQQEVVWQAECCTAAISAEIYVQSSNTLS